ncbi:MAG: N-6 DNA methylase [Proteobacteria bacterium]|nr:N-6 DNA methylase [Pseudomonadota bacterium]
MGLFDKGERILPDLDSNIKWGNSLVGTDMYDQQPLLLNDEEAQIKVNVFDWQDEFSEVFKQGGFDAVIGNPPYVRQETLGEEFKKYAKNRFASFAGTADLYSYFIEKGHNVLKTNGMFGFICSNKFMKANYGAALRSFLVKNATIKQLVDFGELPVFQTAATFPVIILTENKKTEKQSFIYAPIKRLDFESLEKDVASIGQCLDETALAGDNWTLASSNELAVFEKIKKSTLTLDKFVGDKLYRGIITGLTEAFVIDRETRDRLVAEDAKSAEIIKPFAIGDYVRKYRIEGKEKFVILMPKGWTNTQIAATTEDDAWFWLQTNYPSVSGHLRPFAEKAAKRCDKGMYWWELRSCEYYDAFDKPKIVYPDIAKESRFTFDEQGMVFGNTAYFIPSDDLYLLAILNSSLIFNYFKRFASVLGDANKGGRLRWFTQDVVKLPIRTIDPKNSADVEFQTQIIKKVELLITCNVNKSVQNERLAKAMERELDNLVYALYGLTPEERAIVEGVA